MTVLRGAWTALAAMTLCLLTACADGTGAAGSSASPGAPDASAAPPAGDALVLRVRSEGGFVPAEMLAGRLPAVSVYADGRVITEGPQIAIYPGPALPNLQVQQMDPALVDDLVARALDSGVRAGAGSMGRPGVADAPTTVVTVVSGGTTYEVSVVGLGEAMPDDPRLTEAQRAARAKLNAFVKEVSDLSTAPGMSKPRNYVPESVAAISRPYVKPSDGLPSQPPAIAWPGPALPGEPLGATMGCVAATGAEAKAVLAAARQSSAITAWTSGGEQYLVTFRPLLPDETGCAALKAAR